MSQIKPTLLKKCGERGNPFLRSIDYLIGIPIISLLGHFRSKAKLRPKNPEKIALLKTAGIGDTVLLSAVAKDLKKAFPAAQLSLFCGANNYEVGLMLDDIRHVISLPITNPLSAIKKIIHAGTFDFWLNFGPWPRLNSLFTRTARAACKVGFATPGNTGIMSTIFLWNTLTAFMSWKITAAS